MREKLQPKLSEPWRHAAAGSLRLAAWGMTFGEKGAPRSAARQCERCGRDAIACHLSHHEFAASAVYAASRVTIGAWRDCALPSLATTLTKPGDVHVNMCIWCPVVLEDLLVCLKSSPVPKRSYTRHQYWHSRLYCLYACIFCM